MVDRIEDNWCPKCKKVTKHYGIYCTECDQLFKDVRKKFRKKTVQNK